MLTSDENIVTVQFSVQYSVRPLEAKKFLFNLDRQEEAVKSASEAAMREVIGRNPIDVALTGGKLIILNETKILLQSIVDRYDFGVEILTVEMQDVHTPDEVMVALKDVTSAQEDKSRSINEAEAYQNKIIPEARGLAAQTINNAEAYKATTLRRAEGESKRFLAVLAEYNKVKDATKKRMYIEMMEEVLSQPGMEKIVISKDAAPHTLPLLPLLSTQEGK
jgi:membrane protease subunit HflK